MPAETLADAFNELDPLRPVTREQVDRLFVTRPHSPVKKIQAHLQITASSGRPQKLLFVGHRGAGKSSELAYLSTLLDGPYLSIFSPLYEIYKSPSASHIEVVFAIYLSLLKQATAEALARTGVVTDAWEKLLEHIYTPLRRFLFGEEMVTADTQTTFTLKLSLLVADLEAKIGTESYTRNRITEKFESRVAEILENSKQLAHLLEQKLGRRLLLIVEDLDKFDLESTRLLFLEHARTLTAPYPTVIYTFPVAMRYHNNFSEIKQAFDGIYLLPNVALQTRTGDRDPVGWQTMRGILERRVASRLFAPTVQDQLISWSGGHLKSFIQLGQQAVLNAIVDQAETVQADHLEEARMAMRNDYQALLKQEQLDLLRQKYLDPEKDLDDTSQAVLDLLFNGSLLEYENKRGFWGGVNPVVVELLERQKHE
jgi:hypothetical protein